MTLLILTRQHTLVGLNSMRNEAPHDDITRHSLAPNNEEILAIILFMDLIPK